MTTYYYTQPNGRHRVHITTNGKYTLCYREVRQDISEDEPEGEKCTQCYAVKEAQETGQGIPF